MIVFFFGVGGIWVRFHHVFMFSSLLSFPLVHPIRSVSLGETAKGNADGGGYCEQSRHSHDGRKIMGDDRKITDFLK